MALRNHRELKKTKIEIIPMIDTMFFLLVFFILSSLGIIKLQGIKIDMPTASNQTTPVPDKDKPKEILVVIDASKHITVDGIPATTANGGVGSTIDQVTKKALGADPDYSKADVIISADPSVPQGIVVTCIDQARQVNIKNFAIATSDTEAEPAPSAPPAPSTGASNTTTP